ncbi:NrfD/PsrC family molybdoenzyme membrane anchor subunit [Escherichia coli]
MKSSCWWRFLSVWRWAMMKRALVAALGGGFWTWWFWLGVAGLGLIVPMLLKPWVNRSSGIPAVLAACGASLVGVLMLRFFQFSTPGS